MMALVKRKEDISTLRDYINAINKDMTMILQRLQWDNNGLIQNADLIPCKHNSHHRVPKDNIMSHEEKCFYKSYGYSKEDKLLPDPLDSHLPSVIKYDHNKIQDIIHKASINDPTFKKVLMTPLVLLSEENTIMNNIWFRQDANGPEPLSIQRLQSTYTADERRAIHDAVVAAAPSCHDITDLALPSTEAGGAKVQKTHAEVLAELRDMKRRRAKYRVAPKTKNYSHVLKDVIATQMELYTESHAALKAKEIKQENKYNVENGNQLSHRQSSHRDKVHNYSEKSYEKLRDRDNRYHRDNFKDNTIYCKDNYKRGGSKDRNRHGSVSSQSNYRELDNKTKDKRHKEHREHKNGTSSDQYISTSKDRSYEHRSKSSSTYRDKHRREKDHNKEHRKDKKRKRSRSHSRHKERRDNEKYAENRKR